MAGLTPQEISNIIAGQEHTEVRLAFNRISDTGLTEEAYEVFLIRGLPRDSLQSEPPQPTTYTDYGSVPHWQQTPPTIVSPSIALDSGEDNSRGRVRSPLWEAMEDADSAEDGIPSRKSSGVDGFHFPPEVSLGSGGRFGDNGKAGAAQHPPSGGDSGEGLREGMRSLLEFLNSGCVLAAVYPIALTLHTTTSISPASASTSPASTAHPKPRVSTPQTRDLIRLSAFEHQVHEHQPV